MFTFNKFFGEDGVVLRERNFQLLLLANVLAPLGTALVSPVLDSLIDPFGASAANIGLMISAYIGPAIVMIPVAGLLADRFGRKTILVPSIFLFGLAGSTIALTTDFRVALLLRAVQGTAFSGIMPIIITSIGDIYVGKQEATAQGLRLAGSGFSATVIPLIAGALAVIAWQYPFLLHAIALPIAILVYLWFDEPTDEVSGDAEIKTPKGHLVELFRLLCRRRVFAFVIARGLPSVVWFGFLSYNSLIVVRLMDGTPAQAGMLVAAVSFTYAVVGSQAGRITALYDSRLYPLLVANVFLTAGFIVVLFASDIAVATIGSTIVGAGFGITASLYRSIITNLAPQTLRAGLVSIAESGSMTVGTIAPVVMGGIIAVTTPVVGSATAIQISGLVAAIVAGGGGIIALLIANASPSVPIEDDPVAQGPHR